MKLIVTPILILSFFVCQSQLIMLDSETGEYKYEDVVQADNISKSELLNKIDSWNKLYYNNDQFIKIDSGAVKNIAIFDLNWKFINKNIALKLFYDVDIKVKDGRYKYTFSNFRVGKMILDEIEANPLKIYIERFPERYQILIEEPVDTELTKAINSLETYIKTGKMIIEDDNW